MTEQYRSSEYTLGAQKHSAKKASALLCSLYHIHNSWNLETIQGPEDRLVSSVFLQVSFRMMKLSGRNEVFCMWEAWICSPALHDPLSITRVNPKHTAGSNP